MSHESQPELVVLAGPNGAGKSTFYHSQLSPSQHLFVNADVLAQKLGLGAYESAALADRLRRELLYSGQSFIFVTVFSDPQGAKLEFLEEAVARGYRVTLCYIGLADANTSQDRVAMRVSQGGHDVPDEKLEARFPRTVENLRQAILRLPEVRIYDNSDLRFPFRHLATFRYGQPVFAEETLPGWLVPLMPS